MRRPPQASRLMASVLAATLVAALIALVGAATPASAAPELPKPKADIVVDGGTGRVLVCDNIHEAVRPASTAKIVTALAAVERLAPNATVTADAAAAAVESSKIGFPVGTQWPLDQMLAALMMVSANDAAYAVADTISGSVAGFAPVLNATAKQLGMKDSTLNDPAGLDTAPSFQGGPMMSAYDLAVAARNVLAVPELAKWSGMRVYDFTDRQGVSHHFPNHNKLLPGGGYDYAGATGMKTGYTDRAQHAIVASATRNGRTMIAVVLGAVTPGYAEAASLLDAGFAATPTDATCNKETLPPVRVSLFADRAADQMGFVSLARATSVGSGATAPAAASGVPDRIPNLDQAPSHPPVASATVASASKGGGGILGFLSLRNLMIVAVLALAVVFFLRRRAVRRQRAARLARRKQRNAAMRSGGLPVVDGRYRSGLRLGPPVESHVRIRALDDPTTPIDAELDSLDA